MLPPYVDEGYSGKNLERPAIKRLIQDARKNKFDLVVIYKLDRLSRRVGDLTTIGKLLFYMLGSFAQFERGQAGGRGEPEGEAQQRGYPHSGASGRGHTGGGSGGIPRRLRGGIPEVGNQPEAVFDAELREEGGVRYPADRNLVSKIASERPLINALTQAAPPPTIE